uniref:Uncharacterized protein n=1 Tax=Pseudomonas phage Cygsa01 TaxID=3138529 RepID=A0AAU6W3H8_9VIRU
MADDRSFYDNIYDNLSPGAQGVADSVTGGISDAASGLTDYFSGARDAATGPYAVGSSRTLGPLDEFINHVKKYGVSRPNRFRITIPLPAHVSEKIDIGGQETAQEGLVSTAVKIVTVTSVSGGREDAARSLQIMCQVASFPGTNVDTAELKAGGKPRKFAYGLSYDTADFAFLVSNDMREKKIFDYWIKTIVDAKTGAVGFYDDYIVDVTIEQMDEWGRVTHTLKLEEAYPTVVTPMELDMGSTNTAAMLRTSFVYRRQLLGEDDIVGKSATGLPETADKSLFDQVLDNFAPVQIIKNIANGNITGAVNQAAELYMDYKTGNFSGAAASIYKSISDVSRKFTGLGARELETIYGVIKGDIAKNGKISVSDKAELLRVISGVTGAVQKVGGPQTSYKKVASGEMVSAKATADAYAGLDQQDLLLINPDTGVTA